MQKLSQFPLPDYAYNWVADFLLERKHALRVLRAHGLTGPNLGEVTRATAVAKLTFACSSWWSYADSAAKARIQAVMNKFKRLGFLSEDVSFVHTICRITNCLLRFCPMSIMCCINCFRQ